jgi:transposase-like protein
MGSKYDNYSPEELQHLINTSNSIKSIIEKIGLSSNGSGAYITFHKRVNTLGLDLRSLGKNSSDINYTRRCRKNLDDQLVRNSTYSRGNLKTRLLESGYLKNKCEVCDQLPEWCGKPLTLHLDHINGVNNDNRLENLRILCPHCHSQQKTTGSKNKSKRLPSKKVNTCKCGRRISKKSKTCSNCRTRDKKFDPPIDELRRLIDAKTPLTKIGKIYDVSDNAVRKRAKKFGLI